MIYNIYIKKSMVGCAFNMNHKYPDDFKYFVPLSTL